MDISKKKQGRDHPAPHNNLPLLLEQMLCAGFHLRV